jgi:putative protease
MANGNNTPELIMPAGTLDKLRFACAYGADAVYAGMPKFSLRARTNTFTEAELAEGIAYAHARGVKVYLTLNIFARNTRIQPSLEALRAIMSFKPDAVIMSDPGLIMLARQEFPDLVLHLSTQANTMNWAAVQFWKEQGIARIILPRELSIPEIKEIHDHVPDMELEVFVHGAMCIAYSGRCLLSSYLTHRDANLGVCTNSCRWQYKVWQSQSEYALEEASRPGEFFQIDEDEYGTYLLNSRDLCTIEYLKDLREAGVTGFKVEGRTKSVYYLAQIGRAYRKAINDMLNGKPFDTEVLTDVYATASRGFMPGFLTPMAEETRQNYESGEPVYATYKFGGVVRGYNQDKGLVEVEVKNRVFVGDFVEFVSPNEVFEQQIRAMYDLNENPITVAHGGGEHVLLATERMFEPFTILRMGLQT